MYPAGQYLEKTLYPQDEINLLKGARRLFEVIDNGELEHQNKQIDLIISEHGRAIILFPVPRGMEGSAKETAFDRAVKHDSIQTLDKLLSLLPSTPSVPDSYISRMILTGSGNRTFVLQKKPDRGMHSRMEHEGLVVKKLICAGQRFCDESIQDFLTWINRVKECLVPKDCKADQDQLNAVLEEELKFGDSYRKVVAKNIASQCTTWTLKAIGQSSCGMLSDMTPQFVLFHRNLVDLQNVVRESKELHTMPEPMIPQPIYLPLETIPQCAVEVRAFKVKQATDAGYFAVLAAIIADYAS